MLAWNQFSLRGAGEDKPVEERHPVSTDSLYGEEISGLNAKWRQISGLTANSEVFEVKAEQGRMTTPNRGNAEGASSSAEISHTQIWEESGLKTMDANDQRRAFKSSPASLLEMDVNEKQIRSLSVDDFLDDSPPLNQEDEEDRLYEIAVRKVREIQDERDRQRQEELVQGIKEDTDLILSKRWSVGGEYVDWLYADYADQRAALELSEQRLIRDLTEDGESRVYAEFWKWKATQWVQLLTCSKMNVILFQAVLGIGRVKKYDIGGEEENELVVGILEEWHQSANTMTIWN